MEILRSSLSCDGRHARGPG